MYKIVVPFTNATKQYSIALQNTSDCNDTLEFGAVKMGSGIMFARYNGTDYVGYNHANPGSFDESGTCLQRHTTGVTMDSLIATYAQTETPTLFQISPRDEWSATFELLEEADGLLRIGIRLSSPFACRPTDWFHDEYSMHAFA